MSRLRLVQVALSAVYRLIVDSARLGESAKVKPEYNTNWHAAKHEAIIGVMKTGQIASALGVSDDTIRNWLARYPAYFEQRHSRQRSYTEADYAILATIASLASDGKSTAEIEAMLKSGFRVDSANTTAPGVDIRLMPAAIVEQLIDSAELRIELEVLKSDHAKTLDLLAQSNAENKTLHEAITKLNREIGRLEGELNYRKQLDQSE